MEHRDDTALFLRELRQLRDGAGLGHAELAARAHYPYDSIRAAEVGPSLPDLPVLCAFVRACGGTAEVWEERWRSLTKSPSLPVSAARQSGQSDASAAGARINSVTQVGDNPDPSIIMAALNRVADKMASPGAPAPPTVARPLPTLPRPPAATHPRPPAAPLPSDRPTASDRRPAGWDPIRVSSAWPVLEQTPPAAEPTRAQSVPGFAGGAGAPWEAGDPAAQASPGRAGTGTAGRAAPGNGTAPGGRTYPPGTRPGGLSTRTTTIVVAVVVLIVLVVLLAAFA